MAERTCEYYPGKECKFLHKCHSLGCAGDRAAGRSPLEARTPTRRPPWMNDPAKSALDPARETEGRDDV